MGLSETLKLVVPPILVKGGQQIYHKLSNSLFGGDDQLFKEILNDTKYYGEYGCGQSTLWVLRNSEIKVRSVETSVLWIEKVQDSLSQEELSRLEIYHANVGEIGKWGFPKDYSRRDEFSRYTDWLWEGDSTPDTVLIDGRFRVCCFLTALRYSEEGTRIIFDDYRDRPHYHVVESYIQPSRSCGRQCLFVVPHQNKLDYQELEREIENFRHVLQ